MDDALRYPGRWSFDAKQLETLRLFQDRVRESRAFGRFQYPVEGAIKVNGGQISSEAELPPEMELRSAAMCARHFILEKESTQMFKVCNLLHTGTDEKRFHKVIADVRKSFKELMNEKLNPTTGVASIQTTEHLIDAFFHGSYFHSDEEKREFVSNQTEPFAPLHKQAFAQSLHTVLMLTEKLGRIVENALGIDQLAPCETSKKIQAVLQAHGLGPVAISLVRGGNHATKPPTPLAKCFLDICMPADKVEAVAHEVLKIFSQDRPGFPVYEVWYRTEKGEVHGCIKVVEERKPKPT